MFYIDSSPREPRFVLVPLRFASEAWPRAGLGELRSASNANKPASSWPLKQGRKAYGQRVDSALNYSCRKAILAQVAFSLQGKNLC